MAVTDLGTKVCLPTNIRHYFLHVNLVAVYSNIAICFFHTPPSPPLYHCTNWILLLSELFQSIPVASREFKQDILKILSSSYLETLSSTNFAYVKASMIHNDKLEKEFTEKRKELRTEGRTEKELAELYAFLLVDPSEASIICDKGLAVGKSKVTILGNPAMGVYLSKYSDILQPNPLDTGKQADIIIFKIIKVGVFIKAVFDNPTKNFTPPTPKHDCHVSKNLNRVTSLFTYRAFDITQFYLYEIGSEGVRQIPRHVCPYAVVSFVYKEDKIPKTPKSASFLCAGKSHYTVWKGQLVNKGRFFCFGSLRAASQPFLPMKLPEKLDVETVMSIDCLKTKVPAAVFHKNTFCGLREALRNGLYYSLYEFVERGKTGSNLEALLHKLEEDKQVLIKPLGDQGFLLLFSPSEMAGNDEETERHAETTAVPHIGPEALPELSTLVPALHFALDRIRKELPNSLQKTTMDVAFENNLMGYLNCSGKEASAENGKPKFTLPPYEERRFSTVRQKRPNVHRILRSYFFNPFHYQFDVSKALEMLEHHPNREAKIPSPPLECSGDKQKLEPQPAPEEPINSTVTSTDYDPDKIQELIDLIHTRKRHRPGEPSGVNIEGLAHCISDKNNLGLKRKLVCVTERSHKRMKTTQGTANCSVDACSPCTNASLEQLYSRKPSTPESGSENEINWKLIDINHYHSPSNSQAGAGSVSNEYVPDLQNDDPDPTVYETNGHLSASKDSSASVIENMVLLEYNTFANKMRQLLKKEKVRYSAEKKQPTFSTPSKVPSLSRFASVCTRDVAVQNYVSQLRKKMNCVVADACSHRSFKNVCLNPTSPKDLAQTVQNRTAASSTIVQDLDASTSSRLQTLKPTAEEAVNNTGGTYDGQTCSEKTREPEKDPKSDSLKPIPSQLTSGLSSVGLQEVSGMTDLPKARPCITNLIQQLKPEMFCSLVKIIKDVQKNTVKFYVSEVEETSSVCAEIKEYLTGLGNKECHPNQFLKDGCMDKLLIIIQNEDIAAHIHKIPLLMSLKKLSSVSFAGVESLDDVQNHTYNELFVSGGFVVSDETVLNLKSVTIEKLQMFLKFLEDLSSPESKWLWKIHCKIYKRLKEQSLLGTNTAALNILSLLNKYQKCNVVEVLSYHDCDSRARNTIELECLVKLQAQNIQHRHVVFLTEKNLETLPSYSQCGVVVACVEDFVNNFRSLIGYHSSSVENKQLRVESQENLQDCILPYFLLQHYQLIEITISIYTVAINLISLLFLLHNCLEFTNHHFNSLTCNAYQALHYPLPSNDRLPF
uniref:Uncharacterized protein n=1 Tax=Callorhinchus milii TaxID=7868 RepID=A0A4W3HGN8_CALMI